MIGDDGVVYATSNKISNWGAVADQKIVGVVSAYPEPMSRIAV